MATLEMSEKKTSIFPGKIAAPVVTVDVFVRIAGLSGVLAVALGAYGFHAFQGTEEQKKVYSIAQFYHLVHTVALLAVSKIARRPMLVGTLMTIGMLLFCGFTYTRAAFGWTSDFDHGGFTKAGDPAAIGGLLLILAWACTAF